MNTKTKALPYRLKTYCCALVKKDLNYCIFRLRENRFSKVSFYSKCVENAIYIFSKNYNICFGVWIRRHRKNNIILYPQVSLLLRILRIVMLPFLIWIVFFQYPQDSGNTDSLPFICFKTRNIIIFDYRSRYDLCLRFYIFYTFIYILNIKYWLQRLSKIHYYLIQFLK